MTKLPRDVSGQRMVAVLQQVGFVVQRQKGSHIVLKRDDPFAVVTVPNHKALGPGLLRAILRDAGLTVEELIDLL